MFFSKYDNLLLSIVHKIINIDNYIQNISYNICICDYFIILLLCIFSRILINILFLFYFFTSLINQLNIFYYFIIIKCIIL